MTVNLVYISFISIVIVLLIVSLYFISSILLRKRNKEKIQRKTQEIYQSFVLLLQREDGEGDRARKRLENNFSKRRDLRSFYLGFKKYKEEYGHSEELRELLNEIVDYKEIMRSNIVRKSYRKSYTLYLLSEFKVNTDQVGDFALEALDDDSVYVRNNALQVINSKSSLDYMIQAFNKVNQGKKYFNSRIVVDFLDNFRGDTRLLDDEILNKCDQFGPRASSIFIEHLTSTGNDDKRVRDSLLACMDSPVHKEKMIKLTRYFTHIVDERAREHILANMESEHWSLRANTATALGQYPGGDTVEILRKALGDKNYFVRKNAAWSFVKLVPREEVLREIQINEDRFAQDVLKYTIESRVAYGN